MMLLSTIACLFINTSVKGDFEINEQMSSLNIWTKKNDENECKITSKSRRVTSQHIT